ncbi:HAMP domain-containing sensor histidine kinase [Flexivirga caeni]|uniref:histidine kinase n=1 Tax=Flexivirga caeni TaxID=2294115 RepID=A0A3M9M566_9MICO|nr:HAMP domain-containing sensor histidine kinase [Flexivirga caeni]RNI20711.1 HAMP domain-containing protein [Flexivirga caeni]
MSLFWRIYLLNAVVLVAATVTLLAGPVSVSTRPVFAEILVLTVGLALLLALDAILFRIGLAPLRRLSRAMASVDLLQPHTRPVDAGSGEVGEVIHTFNSMLGRLEAERSRSTARALSAQEGERRRIAQELHDEVGQTLTAVLLDLKRVADAAPPEVGAQLREVQETTRGSLEEIRRIAQRLRPGVLSELGLPSALKVLTVDIADRTGLVVDFICDPDLPALDDETELVIYRVAQEALTNVVRHAGAGRAALTLARASGAVELQVRDDGAGMAGALEGAGLQGMRERALLIGAQLSVGAPSSGRGSLICLHVPAGERGGDPHAV